MTEICITPIAELPSVLISPTLSPTLSPGLSTPLSETLSKNSTESGPTTGADFGARVTGVRLAHLEDATFAQIHQAFLRYGFLVFPAQHLSDAENVHFAQRFGELEFGALSFSNTGSDGEIADLDSQRMRTNVGNETWHTDSTYWPVSSKCAMLSAVTVPASGSATELADMRAGYAALDNATRQRIETLSAYHSTQFSQANDLGDFPEQKSGTLYHGEAYLRPLVKTHPETGVKNLFIGRHAFGIPGLSRAASRELLQALLSFVVAEPRRVYRHEWQVGDTLLWDNRALLHRAVPYNYHEPRVLTGTRVAGDPETELAYHPSDPQAQAGREALVKELAALALERGEKRFGDMAARAQDL